MATSTINQDVILQEIPYSSFAWDANNKLFFAANTLTNDKTLYGFLVRPTNGGAMMTACLSSDNSKIYVVGWIPTAKESITENYAFKLYAVMR